MKAAGYESGLCCKVTDAYNSTSFLLLVTSDTLLSVRMWNL